MKVLELTLNSEGVFLLIAPVLFKAPPFDPPSTLPLNITDFDADIIDPPVATLAIFSREKRLNREQRNRYFGARKGDGVENFAEEDEERVKGF
ncbi:hypothetical protein E3N88_36557 [Mikania micrantha]|uniref:Uncharacterized protein n=1 Tax=Mikania micrantha TaxID=192012 RepID=A0A5N6M473_9ASTR|nr:hypothetical protein E3N88_36557 [Mikania micrantha]